MNLSDCYRILEVPVDSSPAVLRRAYRRQAQKWHPDRHQESAEAEANAQSRMQEINLAYSTLQRFVADLEKQADQPKHAEAQSAASRQVVRNRKPAGAQAADDFWSRPNSARTESRRSVGASLFWMLMCALIGGVYWYASPFESSNPDTPTPEQAAITSGGTVASASKVQLGQMPEEILAILGVPTRVDGNIWFYQDSKIQFGKTGVIGWYSSPSYPLKVKPKQPQSPQ